MPHMADVTDPTTDFVPYDKLIGITSDGVPVMSNGDIDFFSGDASTIPAYAPLSTYDKMNPVRSSYTRLGIKWQCVEFIRRYYASRKGIWLVSVPTAEDIWHTENLFTRMTDGTVVSVERVANNSPGPAPKRGDMIIWASAHDAPFGHIAIVVGVSETNKVRIAEQNESFARWPAHNRLWSRELELRMKQQLQQHTQSQPQAPSADIMELVDEDDVILGWVSVKEPDFDFNTGSVSDMFRLVVGAGVIVRVSVPPEVSLPWCDVSNPSHYFLRRSLVHDKERAEQGATAAEEDVPSGFYFIDYDMWCRLARATASLHRIALEATARILDDAEAASLLRDYFGIPADLLPLIRHAWQVTPAMFGRFDFGYDGRRLGMLEYNCDSSAALLECCDIQEKMAQHYHVSCGHSAGSFCGAACRSYFAQIMRNKHVCPSHKLIHFMIDDDDEERYTALCVIQFAEAVGFRTRLCVKLDDFSFADVHPARPPRAERDAHIVDANGETVQLVWKTWSWDTVLSQYNDHKAHRTHTDERGGEVSHEAADRPPGGENAAAANAPRRPTLPDILLNTRIHVLEPIWKLLTGSKAILPFMHSVAPDHRNMLPASFFLSRDIACKHHISKPVNGRAGQNVTMFSPVPDPSALVDVPSLSNQLSQHGLPLSANTSFAASIAPTHTMSLDQTNEASSGKFSNSVVVYQERLFLKKYSRSFFPIFCSWVVGDSFAGVVVREDTSKITKLGSVVAPARVIRSNVALDSLDICIDQLHDADKHAQQS